MYTKFVTTRSGSTPLSRHSRSCVRTRARAAGSRASSESTTLIQVPVAAATPVLTAPPWPLFSWRITRKPSWAEAKPSATSPVASDEPSSTTTTSTSPPGTTRVSRHAKRKSAEL